MKWRFLKSLYREQVIRRAICDYQAICHVETDDDGTYVICTFSDSIADIEKTIQEFSNYLIELTNNRSWSE